MTPKPLTSWDESTAEEMAHSLITGGWFRALPSAGVMLLTGATIRLQPITRDELTRGLPVDDRDTPWDAPCWEAPELFTDEELADLDEQYPEEADGRSAAEVNAEAAALHDGKIATIDRYAAHHGLGPVRTAGDLLALLVTAGVLHQDGDSFAPMYPIPAVEDVFPVSAEELAALIELRRQDAEERAAHS